LPSIKGREAFGLKDFYDPDSPGETFRVLKEKEEREYGEYRTKYLVLQAWDVLQLIQGE